MAIVVGVVLGNKDDDENAAAGATVNPAVSPSIPPTAAVTAVPITALDTLLQNLPNSTQENLLDPRTAQSQAYNWLVNHPNISSLEEWRKEQLFALAIFYYAFAGPHWPEYASKSWLDVTKPEFLSCRWILSGTRWV